MDAFIANVDEATIEGDVVIEAKSLPNDVGIVEDYTTNSGSKVLEEGDLVRVAAGHTEGGQVDRVYRFRGYADFLSTDSGNPDDPDTDDKDESYVLHLLTGSLIAEVDSDGEKTGRIFEVVQGGHDEDNPIVVGTTQSIDDILVGGSFDTDSRFAQYSANLGTEDFTDTKFWEIADASILARSAAASFSIAAGTPGVAVSGADLT